MGGSTRLIVVACAIACAAFLPSTAYALQLLEPSESGEQVSGCYATPWTADRRRVADLVDSLRSQGYIAGSEEGVHERQIGYRVAAAERVLLREARERVERAASADIEAALATGADGRPTVSYGFFYRRAEADERRRAVWQLGLRAEVEPVYQTQATARAVVMAPLAGTSVVGIGRLWAPVDCDALHW